MPEEIETIDDVPPEPISESTEEEDTLEQLADQLLARLDQLDARLAALEQRITEHSHDGFAASEHNHNRPSPDAEPRPTHFWFKPIRD